MLSKFAPSLADTTYICTSKCDMRYHTAVSEIDVQHTAYMYVSYIRTAVAQSDAIGQDHRLKSVHG